jgi:hypothetical protein
MSTLTSVIKYQIQTCVLWELCRHFYNCFSANRKLESLSKTRQIGYEAPNTDQCSVLPTWKWEGMSELWVKGPFYNEDPWQLRTEYLLSLEWLLCHINYKKWSHDA